MDELSELEDVVYLREISEAMRPEYIEPQKRAFCVGCGFTTPTPDDHGYRCPRCFLNVWGYC